MSIEVELHAHAETEKHGRIKNLAKKMIWVTFQREGIHKYPAAAEDPRLADVSFLANPHRHVFHFKVAIQVFHNDRDIEFILFKRWLESLFNTGTLELNYRSCEMLADELYDQISDRHPGRDIEITIAEDGENGATISYNTTKPHLTTTI